MGVPRPATEVGNLIFIDGILDEARCLGILKESVDKPNLSENDYFQQRRRELCELG